MSDIFLSEILVLSLLLFPSLRPFSKRLKKTPAIALFPLFAFVILIFIVLGQGLFFSLLPIFIITLICIITEISRFAMMLRDLPNNFYPIHSMVLRVFILLLIFGAFFTTFYFSPEREIDCSMANAVREPLEFTIADKKVSAGIHFFAKQEKNENAHILVLDNFSNSHENGNSISRYFMNANYSVTELTNFNPSFRRSFLSLDIKRHKQFSLALNEFLSSLGIQNKRIPEKILQSEFNLALSKTVKEIKNGRKKHGLREDVFIYVFSESADNEALYEYVSKHPNDFEKVFFLLDEASLDSFKQKLKSNNGENLAFVFDERKASDFSREEALAPYCVYIQAKNKLSRYGDLRGDDVLAAFCLGSKRDLGREERQAVARAFEKYLSF